MSVEMRRYRRTEEVVVFPETIEEIVVSPERTENILISPERTEEVLVSEAREERVMRDIIVQEARQQVQSIAKRYLAFGKRGRVYTPAKSRFLRQQSIIKPTKFTKRIIDIPEIKTQVEDFIKIPEVKGIVTHPEVWGTVTHPEVWGTVTHPEVKQKVTYPEVKNMVEYFLDLPSYVAPPEGWKLLAFKPAGKTEFVDIERFAKLPIFRKYFGLP